MKAMKYRLFGFTDFKIKLSGQFDLDKTNIMILTNLGISKENIRLDGNNIWSDSSEAVAYLKNLGPYFWAVEEPIKANDYVGLEFIADQLNIQIILDESFLDFKTIEIICGYKNLFIPNIRISKLGGFLNTLKIIKELEKNNQCWILGSHVGETSLLTRVALAIESVSNSNFLIKKEGAFSTHILSTDPFYPNLKLCFSAGVKDMKRIDQAGWGLEYEEQDLI
jgi:L-Ala-D/L-Glu epimerase